MVSRGVNRQAVVAAIGRQRTRGEERHLAERERDHDEIDAAGAQAHHAGREGEQRAKGEAPPAARSRRRRCRATPVSRRHRRRGRRTLRGRTTPARRSRPEDRARSAAMAKIITRVNEREHIFFRRRMCASERHERRAQQRSHRRRCRAANLRGLIWLAGDDGAIVSAPSPETARSAGYRERPPSADRSASTRWPGRPCAPARAA